MNYREHIGRCLNYIEKNLKNDLSLDDLARTAGYSKYHFIRVFKEVTGLTPAAYICKRRLSEIAREIQIAGGPISDIAFSYGFNSKENFIHSFKTEHHILPTEYKASKNSLKLYERFETEIPPFSTTPELTLLNSFGLMVFKSGESSPPDFWNKYNCKKLSRRLSGGQPAEDYGVSLYNSEKNKLDYFIGIRTEEACGDTPDAIPLRIQGGRYAVFTTPTATQFDFVNVIHRTWDYIGRVWLPQSRFRRTDGYEFETYAEAGRTFSEKIFIPVKPR